MIEIRRAGPADVDALAVLFDAYRQFYEQPSNVAAARAFLAERLQRGESVIFVAAGDQLLGFTQLYPSFSSVSLRRMWILNDLFVRPVGRRSGIARRLLERARDWATETGAKGLALATAPDNEAARALYESCGWRADGFQHYELVLDHPQ